MPDLPPSYISDTYAADIVRRHFNINQDISLAVAIAESGLNINAHNTSGEDSRGIYQINVAPNANPQYASWDLYDPEVCAQAAYEVSSSGSYWCPWSVFEESCGPGHTGGYRYFLDRARDALGLLPPPPPPPVDAWPATNLHSGPFQTVQGNVRIFINWIPGGPDQVSQTLELQIYPLGWETARRWTLQPFQSNAVIANLYPGAGFRWRIVTVFIDRGQLASEQSEFIVPGGTPPPTLPEVVMYLSKPNTQALYVMLAVGIFAVGMIALTGPRKVIIIKKPQKVIVAGKKVKK